MSHMFSWNDVIGGSTLPGKHCEALMKNVSRKHAQKYDKNNQNKLIVRTAMLCEQGVSIMCLYTLWTKCAYNVPIYVVSNNCS